MPGRSVEQMRFQVLNCLIEGRHKPTHLLQSANLNFRVFKTMMAYMEGLGLVRQQKVLTRIEWYITDKGVEKLALYHQAIS